MAKRKRRNRREAWRTNSSAFPEAILDPDGYVSVKGFAKYFSISMMTVYRGIIDGTIKVVRIGRAIRIPKESVREYAHPEVELDPEGYFAAKQFARHFNVSMMTAYRRIDDGSVPVVWVGRAKRIPRRALDWFLRNESSPGKRVISKIVKGK